MHVADDQRLCREQHMLFMACPFLKKMKLTA